jgi:uncharacterized protein (DUF2342 family)
VSVISWPLAAKVARRMAGSHPLEDTYHFARFSDQAPDLVARAAELAAKETGLPWTGVPNVAVVSRRDWAGANVAGFGRLLERAEEKLEGKGGLGRRMAGRLVAAEVGALVGVLAKRVLGGGNVLTMERQHEFRPDEFRFWVALHECTHRLQFTGVPWLRGHFLELVDGLVDASAPEAGRLQRIAGEMKAAASEGRPVVDESGIMGLFASPDQKALLERMQALMSLLEGHGHVVMDRIGARELVTQDRMARVLKLRRKDPRTAAFFRLTGLEMKMRQYEMGEKFILGVERIAGFGALDTVWESPDRLPTLDEIRSPQRWLERVG